MSTYISTYLSIQYTNTIYLSTPLYLSNYLQAHEARGGLPPDDDEHVKSSSPAIDTPPLQTGKIEH